MSKIQEYNKSYYPSIMEGIRALREPHRIGNDEESEPLIYSEAALDKALTFLCLNDIPHQYTRTECISDISLDITSVVCLDWTENGYERRMIWFEQRTKGEYCLIKFCDNWADEMEVEGFVIFDYNEYREWRKDMNRLRAAMNNDHVFEFYFGTNEWLDYENYDDFIVCFDMVYITKEEKEAIERLFGKFYGVFPYYAVLDFLKDVEDEDGAN